ncbi:MAG: diacylglycerol/lipid kinase family protein [Planctomycetaceae bacterium]
MASTQRQPRWVAIQRNPGSGVGASRALLGDLIRELRGRGIHVRLFRHRDRLARFVAANDPETRLGLVAAGGDGTVRDLLNRFPGIPLAILPMGTENLLARYLGIPASGATVARLIDEGQLRTLDLGLIADRRFAVMASVGFDAEVVRRVHEARSGHISHAAYIQPILDSLRTYDYPRLRVWIDDAPRPEEASLVEVVNLPAYALGLPVARSASGHDGRLDLRLFEQGSAFQMMRYLCNVALGTHETLPDVKSLAARRVRIESSRRAPVQADGDPAGGTPVEISVLPGAMQVFAPPA